MLSQFSQDILNTLANADEPLHADEIAKRMSDSGKQIYSAHHVRTYLEYALQEAAKQTIDGRWKLASEPTDEPEENTPSLVGEDASAEGEKPSQLLSSLDGLDRSIAELLFSEEKPLRASEIAAALSTNLRMVSETAIRSRLSRDLHDYVKQDLQYRWYLKEDVLREATSDVAEDRESASSDEETVLEDEEYTELILPLIQLALDDAERPISAAEIAGATEFREHDISKQEVTEALLNNYPGEMYLVPEVGWVFRKDDLSGNNCEDSSPGRSATEYRGTQRPDSKPGISPSSRADRQEPLTLSGEETSGREGNDERNQRLGSVTNNPSATSPSTHEEADQLSEWQQLMQAVASILETSGSPLRKHEITVRLRDAGLDVSRDEVTSALCDGQGSTFALLSDSTWALAESVASGDVVVGGATNEESNTDRVVGPTNENPKESDHHEQGSFLNSVGGQSGKAASIGRYLQIADRISLILGLSAGPLSLEELTDCLVHCGYQVQEQDVRRTLESILPEFVIKTSHGYSLNEPVDKQSSHAGADGHDQQEAPVDESTRARLSGNTYEYTFHSEPFESAALFHSQLRGGTVRIVINESHPVYSHLRSLVDPIDSEDNPQTDLDKLSKGVQTLLAAWVDLESNLTGRQGKIAEELRTDWGRTARLLLRSDSDS